MELYFGVLCLLSLLHIAKGSLLCSVCDSVTKPDCEVNPPAATLCWQSGQGVKQSCTTIREYKIDTEILLMFRRDCSTMDEGTCYNPQGQNKTLCIDVCFTDNCNAAASSVLPSYKSLLPLITALLLLLPCL
ncbi:uncharacterized protein LOC125378079 [Haliotis rufescens]|uniref:uncharacterized protein LOC125378079 n=1 Tax=Haliotis rufescens TaxID=6454 RepID=UPI00201F8897|nr:uncharacterized protein LOC125378079 [Haliotis rufescens]